MWSKKPKQTILHLKKHTKEKPRKCPICGCERMARTVGVDGYAARACPNCGLELHYDVCDC